MQTLVLNKNWQPVAVTSVERTFGLLCTGSALALDADYQVYDFDSWMELGAEYGDDVVKTPQREIVVPKIIVLQVYDRLPQKTVRFSRQNIYVRDDFTCQYCQKRFGRSKLNLDHVVPKCQGGRTSWENVVASCVPCNLRKGGRTPSQAGITLKTKPKRPKWSALFSKTGRKPHKEWLIFMDPVDAAYWNVELEDDSA